MPEAPPPARTRALPLLTRRQGLLALSALVAPVSIAACSSDDATPTATRSAAQEPSPSVSTIVAAEEAALIALYDSALASLVDDDPRRRDLLLALRDQHVHHRDALDPTALGPAEDTAAEPVSRAPGLRDLAEAERRAAKARIKACVNAGDPDLARTLAFIAASEASHVPALLEAM